MGGDGGRLTGRVLHGTFVVDESIGEGGMGAVYAAHNAKTPAIRYAVKVLRTEGRAASEQEAQRFRREAQALAALDHVAIVRPIHADVTPEGDPYLVMELVRGTSLRARLDAAHEARTYLPLPFVLAVLDAIADALDHAHGRGIIHRDLKPENVLVTDSARSASVKVLDFGIAKIVRPDGQPSDPITRTSQIAGTLSYMSPEQCRNLRDAGPRSDQFSLGVMAFELLTGVRPFQGDNPANLICAILLNPIPPATLERPDLPDAVDPVLARMCAKEPAARYATPSDAVAALAEALGQTLASGAFAAVTPPAMSSAEVAPPAPRAPDPAAVATLIAPFDRPLESTDARQSSALPAPRRVSVRGERRRSQAPVSRALDDAPPPRRRLGLFSIVAIVTLAAGASGAAVLLAWRRGHARVSVPARPVGESSHSCPRQQRAPTDGLFDDEVWPPGWPRHLARRGCAVLHRSVRGHGRALSPLRRRGRLRRPRPRHRGALRRER